MKRLTDNTRTLLIIPTLIALFFVGSSFRTADGHILGKLQEDPELYDQIVAMDKAYFTAYNNCDMEKQAEMYADDIEFYHDKGGLSTSKKDLLESIEKNICGKVTRELVEGSIEVYPIHGFGAVEIGMHKFHNKEEPDAVAKPSKFITIWEYKEDTWKIKRVISLH